MAEGAFCTDGVKDVLGADVYIKTCIGRLYVHNKDMFMLEAQDVWTVPLLNHNACHGARVGG